MQSVIPKFEIAPRILSSEPPEARVVIARPVVERGAIVLTPGVLERIAAGFPLAVTAPYGS